MENARPAPPKKEKPQWLRIVAQYQGANRRQSMTQIITSFGPYFLLWIPMYISLSYSYWITLALSVLASGFLLRTFIIFHDCTHGSFFKSRKANDAIGIIAGLLSFTPYHEWRHRHNLHHATTGNLDKRGWWDIEVVTVREYLQLAKWERLRYRLYRNPWLMFGLGSTLFFLVVQRFPRRDARKRERNSVLLTNLAIVGMAAGMSALIGLKAYLMIQLPIAILSSMIGLWMFYVQHQFEEGYWEHNPEWDYVTASLKGSSYYKLPRILQWFTGNIGFHHIHHLSPKIPNYKLPACHNENPSLQVKPMTLLFSLKSLHLRLWDEENGIMVGWSALKTYRLRQRERLTA
jgi:omega-6 fatty acid desaturase (delta-12 desaturase)